MPCFLEVHFVAILCSQKTYIGTTWFIQPKVMVREFSLLQKKKKKREKNERKKAKSENSISVCFVEAPTEAAVPQAAQVTALLSLVPGTHTQHLSIRPL